MAIPVSFSLSMLESELQKIGLSEKEAKVYLSALELGPSPVQKIASKAKVNRATTYVILEGLMKKGIITTFDQGKKRLFVAEGPHALKNVIHQQQQELDKKEKLLESLFNELMSVHNLLPNKPVVRFYEGKEGLKTMLDQEFLSMKSNEALLVYSPHAVADVFTLEEMQAQQDKRIKKGIKARSIRTGRPEDDEEKQQHLRAQRHDIRRVPENKFQFSSDIEIWDDKVMMASLKGNISGVIIESKAIADTLRSLFQLAFEGADKYETDFHTEEPEGK